MGEKWAAHFLGCVMDGAVGKVEQLNQEKTPKQYFNNEKAQNNRLTTESFKVY